jgi:hypothetical protein
MLLCYALWQAFTGKKEGLLGIAPTPTKMELGTLKVLAPLTKRKREESAM